MEGLMRQTWQPLYLQVPCHHMALIHWQLLCHHHTIINSNMFSLHIYDLNSTFPDSKVHGANMGPTWVLSAPDGPQIVPMNIAIRVIYQTTSFILANKLLLDHSALQSEVFIWAVLHSTPSPDERPLHCDGCIWSAIANKTHSNNRIIRNIGYMMMSSNGSIFQLLALCVGNSPVNGEFPTQRPVTQSFDVFFDMHLNKQLSKQSWGWWFETTSHSLWRHCNYLVQNRN